MMTDNPISKIEDEKAWMDFGKQAYLIMKGALNEGSTREEAMAIVAAFYAGTV